MEYLSLSDVPYKRMWLVVTFIWLAMGAVWVGNWWRYRQFNVRLQRVVSVVPFVHAALTVCSNFYWNEASVTGSVNLLGFLVLSLSLALFALHSHYPKSWGNFIFGISVFAEGAIYGALLLTASGFGITKAEFR